MPINYKQGGDTGDDLSTAIQPITDGEPVNQTITQRPTENLRKRVELVKTFIDNQEALIRIDRGTVIAATGTIAFDGGWNGTSPAPAVGVANSGAFVLEAGKKILLRPITAPSVSNKAALTTGALTFTSNKYDFQGGNEIEVEIKLDAAVPAADATVTMEGGSIVFDDYDGVARLQNRIVVKYSSTTTLLTVKTKLASNATVVKLVTVTLPVPNESDLASTAITAPTKLSGGVDAELHELEAATLVTFFSTEANRLQQGDALCVSFTTDLVRRQSLYDEALTVIPSASLFNSRNNPEKLHYSLPIFVVPDGQTDFGVFADSTRCDKGETVTIGKGGVGVQQLASTTTPTGASLVGAPLITATAPATPTGLSAGTVEQQLADLLTAVNARIRRSGGNIDGIVTVNASGSIIPNATGRPLGTASSRFDLYAETIDLYNKLIPKNVAAQIGTSAAADRMNIFGLDLDADSFTAGVNKLSSDTDAALAKINVGHRASTTDYTLLLESAPAAGTKGSLRLYAKDEILAITINAEWVPATNKWQADDNTSDASYTRFSTGTNLYILDHLSTSSDPWDDAVTPSVDWEDPGVSISTSSQIFSNPRAGSDFSYTPTKTYYHNVNLGDVLLDKYGLDSANEWAYIIGVGAVGGSYLTKVSTTQDLAAWQIHLPDGVLVTEVRMWINVGGPDITNEVEWGLDRVKHTLTGGSIVATVSPFYAIPPNYDTIAYDGNHQEVTATISAATAVKTIDNSQYIYRVWLRTKAGMSPPSEVSVHKIRIAYTMTNLRPS